LEKLETSLEALGDIVRNISPPGAEAEKELAKSLKQIEIAYKKNIEQLGKDLNRMEFRVT
jgi:hypothetical protein